jgi:hypothetical protein
MLALVLVVALAFSLVTVASSATVNDYSDASSIKQTEAVDLFTQLGFLIGDGGAFSPAAYITRESAAKLICYMLLGTTKADALKTGISDFSDVDPSRWSAGFIQYCARIGVLNGSGSGLFDPAGKVTGNQFAKMCLTALGYGKNGEYTGTNWEMNVIADAARLGVFTGIAGDNALPTTREQCAQMGFNSYTRIAQVVYNSETNSYQNAYDTLGAAAVPTSAGTLANDQGVGAVTKVLNGVTYRYWVNGWGVVLSGDYPTDNTIFTSANGASLVALTTKSLTTYKGTVESSTGVAGAAGDVTAYYVNGVGGTGAVAFAAADAAADVRGAVVQFINLDGDANAEKVVVTQKTFVKLAAAPVVNSAAGTTTVLGICNNYKSSFIIGADGLIAGARVLWYADEYGIIRIEKCKPIAGQATEWAFNPTMNTMALTFGGTKYSHSELQPFGLAASVVVDSFMAANGAGAFNASATIWVDDGNNIVDIALNTQAAAPTYGLVLDYQYNGPLANTALVRLFKQDGSVRTYNVAADNFGIVPDQRTTFVLVGVVTGYLVRYVDKPEGKVALYTTNSDPAAVASVGTTLNLAYTAKGSSFSATAGGVQSLTYKSAVFYFDTAQPYGFHYGGGVYNYPAVKIGFSATTNVTNGLPVTYYKSGATANVAEAVLFSSPAVAPPSQYAYLLYTIPTTYVSEGTMLYDYPAYVNGMPVTLTAASQIFTTGDGLYLFTLDGFGRVKTATEVGGGPLAPVNGIITTIGADGSYLVYGAAATTVQLDKDTRFYQVVDPVPGVSPGVVTPSTPIVGHFITYLRMNVAGTAAAEIFFVS